MKRWSMKAMWMAAAVSAAADSPYLPAVGPAPLRFATPPVVKAATIQLPPLITIEPQPAPAAVPVAPAVAVPPATAVSQAPNTPPSNLSAPVVEPPPSVQASYDPVVSNRGDGVRPDMDNLTPQMFMKFFTGRPATNSPGLTIIAPMPFLPPAPAAPSSTATFQTTPPAKP